jgi:broad specificity phosphatase PhoE
LETADFIAAQSGLRFAVWKETYEYRNKGRYVGPSVGELRRLFPSAEFGADMEPEGWVCPGTETPADVIARGQRGIEASAESTESRIALLW